MTRVDILLHIWQIPSKVEKNCHRHNKCVRLAFNYAKVILGLNRYAMCMFPVQFLTAKMNCTPDFHQLYCKNVLKAELR